MSTELDGASAIESPGVATPPGASVERLSQLEEENRQYREAFEALEPIAPIAQRLLRNPQDREYVNEALTNYDRLTEQRKPKMSEEYETLKRELTEEIGPIREVALDIKRSQKEQLTHRQTALVQEAREYFQPYIDADPELLKSELLGSAFSAAQAKAIERGESFKDTWSKMGGEKLMPKREVRAKPPGSLRASEGRAGIPAAPAPAKAEPGKPFDFKKAVADAHRRTQQTRPA